MVLRLLIIYRGLTAYCLVLYMVIVCRLCCFQTIALWKYMDEDMRLYNFDTA